MVLLTKWNLWLSCIDNIFISSTIIKSSLFFIYKFKPTKVITNFPSFIAYIAEQLRSKSNLTRANNLFDVQSIQLNKMIELKNKLRHVVQKKLKMRVPLVEVWHWAGGFDFLYWSSWLLFVQFYVSLRMYSTKVYKISFFNINMIT